MVFRRWHRCAIPFGIGVLLTFVLTAPGSATPRIPIPLQQDTARPDSVFITAFPGGDHAWFASQISRGSRAVRIENVSSASECESRQVEFAFLTNEAVTGQLQTQTLRGIWFRPDTTRLLQVRGDSAYLTQPLRLFRGRHRLMVDSAYRARWFRPYCYASTRWRLGDVPGDQLLRARLVRKDSAIIPDSAALHTVADFKAVAHALPGIIVGLSYLPHGVTRVDVPTGPDSAKEVARRSRSVQPIIGVDFPLLITGLDHGAQSVLSHFRPMIATSYGDPGFDIYTGLEIFPGIFGARALGNPFQISIGHKFGVRSSSNAIFVAAHFNASGAITNVLGALGAPK